MDPLTLNDVVDIAEYEALRDSFRREVMELKKHRRIAIGEFITLVFENRETMKFQVQEMMRVERIVAEERIKEEIGTYNQLIPAQNELKATLFIEVTEQELIKPTLDRFQGIDHGNTTFLSIGNELIEAEFEDGRSNGIKLSAVHYVTFCLTNTQIKNIQNFETPVSLKVAHITAEYVKESSVPMELRHQFLNDLLN